MPGSVIFQKVSQGEAPSMRAASYTEGEIVCLPAKNNRICTPEYHRTSTMEFITATIESDHLPGKKSWI
ncbi:hypothetical protein D3C76_1196130 [compost metagenome]